MQALKGQNDTSPLIGMELSDLRDALGPEQPAFRARQVFEALYRQQVADLFQISTLPQVLRQQLLTSFHTGLPVIEKLYRSIDGTQRYLLRLEDNRTVETVLMPEEGRDTICISARSAAPSIASFALPR